MQAKLREKLLSGFEAKFREVLPCFERAECSAGSRDTTFWKCSVSPTLNLFVLVSVANSRDEFSVELGWSDIEEFPWREWCFKFENLGQLKGRERLSVLWILDGSDRPWQIVERETMEERGKRLAAEAGASWAKIQELRQRNVQTTEKANERVAELIVDAFGKLIEFGVPLFKRLAGERGCCWRGGGVNPTDRQLI